MKILVPDAENCIIMAMRSNDRWYLLADKDERGRANLYLNISGVESPIMSSADIRRRGLTLTEDQTLGFFGALTGRRSATWNHIRMPWIWHPLRSGWWPAI